MEQINNCLLIQMEKKKKEEIQYVYFTGKGQKTNHFSEEFVKNI